MIAGINSGGVWFRTRENNYLKIGRSDTDDCLYAMACAVKPADAGTSGAGAGASGCGDSSSTRGNAHGYTLVAGAYTFGTDWFDISFHGRLIDIYVDPDTLQHWDVIYSEPVLQLKDADGRIENASRLALFCRQADREIREAMESGAVLKAFQIDGAGFARELEPSEAKMGRRKSIFSLVDTSKLKNE